ncbi:MAG TPA: hypothetical protein P5064_05125 [Clostridia bacterium]|mgnify:CR=1 FL=1|jgi:DNA-directed RNA polymerase subunit F|nr:hypothetical protein [Clostridiaceae bacterium]HOF26422.1 hypothetical protein [Clostridia bacterium]HOM34117.1 hypothetical protein [Clostridia bacterium]HOR89697.1 hypothetical protein [Clostridia bacterium]HOT70704.1 hypothetical protein [Clostridia bacterium]
MRKNTAVKFLISVMVVVLALSLAGCGPKARVREEVELFVEKANALDYQGMFDLMAPETVREIRGNKSVADFLKEKTSAEIADAIVKQLLPAPVGDAEQFLKTLTMEYEGADIREDFSSLYCVVTYEIDGQKFEKDAVFNMLRKNVSEPWTVRDIAL